MLDLSKIYKDNYYEVRLIDGTELKLKRPTQAMVEVAMEMMNDDTNDKEAVKRISQLFARILNRNTDDKVFTREDLIEEYDINIIVYVIKDYFEYWNKEVADKVDFQ